MWETSKIQVQGTPEGESQATNRRQILDLNQETGELLQLEGIPSHATLFQGSILS